MFVSNNQFLNILLPNDNKALKEVLQNADEKTIENLKKGNSSVGDILKNLFDDLKNTDKNKTNIENLLRNTNLFKDLGNFSNSIKTLLNNIENNPNLEKYKALLQNFLKEFSQIDDKDLKDLFSKSGIFFEAKALEQTKGQNLVPKDLENILNQIKNMLKEIPSLEAKKIETLIDKILQNNLKSPSELKTLINNLQELSKSLNEKQVNLLSSLLNSLKNISKEAQLLESKINNFNLPNTQILENQQNITNKTLDILMQLKNELSKNLELPNSHNILKQIDTLLQSKDLFLDNKQIDTKTLLAKLTNLNEIKTASSLNQNISNLVSSLKMQSDNIEVLENKLFQNVNIQNEKSKLTNEIQTSLTNLKTELLSLKSLDTNFITQIIDKILNLQNIFSKIELPFDIKNLQQNFLNQNLDFLNFKSNFESNINNLILNLKESIVNLSSNQNNLNLQDNIIKTVEKLQNILNAFLQNSNPTLDKQISQNTLQQDMKAILLQIQNDLSSKTDISSQELSKQVDRMINQVEYHQLLSIVTNSNNIYIPFLWDMLDEGSISMKKLDEEKFYCEINLSLKEFGQTQLLLALYDKNKLDLTVYASQDDFKEKIRENIGKLKQGLNSVELIPIHIKILDMKKDEETKENKVATLYNQNSQDINLGLDIRV